MNGDASVSELVRMMGSQIQSFADSLDSEEVEQFLGEICASRRIYVTGMGRSGLVARAFAMRLMHVGLEVFVIGETVTPALKKGDTLVIFSGSGETRTVAEFAEAAKRLGGRLCLVTAERNSRIGRVADCIVEIESQRREDESTQFEVRQITGKHKSLALPFAPLGTLFETEALVFADAVISAIMILKECEPDVLSRRRANIE